MNALDLTREFVSFDSTSCYSNVDVTDCVEEQLKSLGCEIERFEYDDPQGVRKANIVGKLGSGTGGVAYFGHTDVVPADNWYFKEHGPYAATVVEDKLYGRGTCDMKGSVACFIAAAAKYQAKKLAHPIYITCTADEETGGRGALELVERSAMYAEMVEGDARGIVGEPTSLDVVYAHKGAYGFFATARGRAAHSSTGEGINANMAMIPFVYEMYKMHQETLNDPQWLNNEFSPPHICWNIGINDHTRAINITPPQSVCTVYFRPMPGQNPQLLLDRARKLADELGLEFREQIGGPPLYVDPKSPFIHEVLKLASREKPRTVGYGTDGLKFTNLKKKVVIGPGSISQAHTHDEWVELDQLDKAVDLYARMIETWCL